MSKSSLQARFLVAVGLMACLICAPGCSTLRDVRGYYSSSRWYEDLGTAAGFVLIGGAVAGVVILYFWLAEEGGSPGGFPSSGHHNGSSRSRNGGAKYDSYMGYAYRAPYHGSGLSR